MSGFLKFVLIGLAAMSGAMAMPILMSSEATPSPCRNAQASVLIFVAASGLNVRRLEQCGQNQHGS